MDVVEAKRALRREMKAKLARISADVAAGETVAEAVMAFIDSKRASGSARVVALFASLPREIDTRPLDERLRRAGIVRAAPAIVNDALVFRVLVDRAEGGEGLRRVTPSSVPLHDLPPGVMDIPTPPEACPVIDPVMCHAVVVPGLAFDLRGRRLGYGRGFYDGALARVDMKRAVAILLDEQLVDEVPCEPHDVRLAWLCTPARGVFAVDDGSARR